MKLSAIRLFATSGSIYLACIKPYRFLVFKLLVVNKRPQTYKVSPSLIKCLLLFAVQTNTVFSQCLKLRGSVTDITTNKVLEAGIFVKEGNKKTSIGNSTANGQYTVSVPCGAAVLVVEKSGYRQLVVPINYNENVPDNAEFVVPFPLIPLDKQVNDRPYAQAEQKEFVLKDTSRTNQKVAIRHFKAFDAINNQFVSANICLFYTKTKQKNCFQTSVASPYFEVSFPSKDIVAMEVSAEGYQNYNGNLILDQIDGQTRLYEIKLSRALTVLSVTLTEPVTPYRVIIKSDTDKDWIDLKPNKNNRFYGVISSGKEYQVCILNENRQVTNILSAKIKAGFNYLILTPKIIPKPAVAPEIKEKTLSPIVVKVPKVEESVKTNIPKPASFADSYVFYFNQSNYELRTDTQQELNKLAAWLQENKQQKIRIIGHTDNVGDPNLNVALSEFRAKVTRSYLLAHQVPESQIEWRGVGGKYPALPNDTEENRKQNRRVEVKLIEGN